MKLLPSPPTLVVTGTILVGSVMELVSSGLAALSAMDCPLGSIRAKPAISTRTGCGVEARFTIFK